MKQSKKSKVSVSAKSSSSAKPAKSVKSAPKAVKSAKSSQAPVVSKSAKSKSPVAAKSASKLEAKSAPKQAAKSKKSQSAKVVKTGKKSAAKKASQGRDISERQDIVRLILEDHKPLKELIPILKNPDLAFEERQEAFSKFSHLLINHSKPEEQSLYVYMKDEDELAEEGFEGDVEHAIAEQLVNEIKGTGNKDLWSARVKVLAELVEHHIEEEEEELLPDFKKYAALEDRIQLGEAFLRLKAEYIEMEERANVPEESQEMHIPNH